MATVYSTHRQFGYSDIYGEIFFDNYKADVDDLQLLRLVQMNPGRYARTPFPAEALVESEYSVDPGTGKASDYSGDPQTTRPEAVAAIQGYSPSVSVAPAATEDPAPAADPAPTSAPDPDSSST